MSEISMKEQIKDLLKVMSPSEVVRAGNEIVLEWEREKIIKLAREHVEAMRTAGVFNDLEAIQYLAEMTAPLQPKEKPRQPKHRISARKQRKAENFVNKFIADGHCTAAEGEQWLAKVLGKPYSLNETTAEEHRNLLIEGLALHTYNGEPVGGIHRRRGRPHNFQRGEVLPRAILKRHKEFPNETNAEVAEFLFGAYDLKMVTRKTILDLVSKVLSTLRPKI
jgi:hypothetical protein